MIFFYILIGIAILSIILGIIIFRAGGKEIDRRLNALGGINTIYKRIIDVFLVMPNARLISVRPSSVVVMGHYNGLEYEWKIYTLDALKLTIRFIVRKEQDIIERKIFDFPFSSDVPYIEILTTLHAQIEHKELLEN